MEGTSEMMKLLPIPVSLEWKPILERRGKVQAEVIKHISLDLETTPSTLDPGGVAPSPQMGPLLSEFSSEKSCV